MARIYKNAEMVIIWLGASNPKSDLAAQVVNGEIGGYLKKISFPRHMRRGRSFAEIIPEADPLDVYNWLKAFDDLCSQKYWERLWIVQEILMAWHIIIQWHTSVMSWKDLSASFDTVHLIRAYDVRIPSEDSVLAWERRNVTRSITGSNARSLSLEWRERRQREGNPTKNSGRPLLHLCTSFGGGKCENILDKVFALHGLALPCCRDAIPVDYTLSWLEICTSMLEHYTFKHAGEDYTLAVNGIQAFHQTLAIMPNGNKACETRLPSLQHTSLLNKVPPTSILKSGRGVVSAIGNIRGRISHLSRSLDATINVHTPGLPSDSRIIEPPFLTDLARDQLRYVMLTGLPESVKTGKHPHVTSELDLVISFNETPSFGMAVRDPSFPNYISGSHFWEPGLKGGPLDVESLQNTEKLLNKVFTIAQNVAAKTDARQSKLAFEENGLICFVPNDTKAGDFLCQFRKSNILVVVRQFGRRYQIVGRAVDFLASPSMHPFKVCGKRRGRGDKVMDVFDVRPCALGLFLDYPTLRLMTASSSTPDHVALTPEGLVTQPAPSQPTGEVNVPYKDPAEGLTPRPDIGYQQQPGWRAVADHISSLVTRLGKYGSSMQRP
jgi:hypothetical protein